MISATVAGNLGHDAELRHTQGGDAVCSFSVASSRKGRDGKDETTWVRCSLWGKRGTALVSHLTKGSRVTVAGSLSMREYESKGIVGTSLELNVTDIALMGGGVPRDEGRSERRQPPKDAGDAYEDDLPY